MPWFIFTSAGECITVEAEDLTLAVKACRRVTPQPRGQIVGAIRGAAQMNFMGQPRQTHVFGVVCCVKEMALGEAQAREGVPAYPAGTVPAH